MYFVMNLLNCPSVSISSIVTGWELSGRSCDKLGCQCPTFHQQELINHKICVGYTTQQEENLFQSHMRDAQTKWEKEETRTKGRVPFHIRRTEEPAEKHWLSNRWTASPVRTRDARFANDCHTPLGVPMLACTHHLRSDTIRLHLAWLRY
jgi:hypothetical protein